MTLDSQIRDRLERLPPTLRELYSELYDRQVAHTVEAVVIRHIFCWVLSARAPMNSSDLADVVSFGANISREDISEEIILDLRPNLLVLNDATGLGFRLAHLSVREFLKEMPEFSASSSNALLATICVSNLFLTSRSSIAHEHMRKALPDLENFESVWGDPYNYEDYSLNQWAYNCELAGIERQVGGLKDLLEVFLLPSIELADEHPFDFWHACAHENYSAEDFDHYEGTGTSRRLEDSLNFQQHSQFIACAFGLHEIVHMQLRKGNFNPTLVSHEGLSAITLAFSHG